MYHFIPFITSFFVERCHRKKEKKRSRKNHTWTDNEVGEWMNNSLISFSSHYLLTVWQREWHRWQGKTSFHECLCVYLTRRGVSKSDFGVYSMKACLLSACVFVYVCRWQKMAASLVIVVYLHIKAIQRQTQCDREKVHLLRKCFKLSVRCHCVWRVNSTTLKLFELEK